MNRAPNTFQAIVALWPSQRQLAMDLGISHHRVNKWSSRNSIPAQWYSAVISAAHRRGWHWVDADLLIGIAAGQRYDNGIQWSN